MTEVGVGIDVGSAGIVLVRGGVPVLLDVPVGPELSGRVGDDVPLVVLDHDGHHVRHGHEMYADLVDDALAAASLPRPDAVTAPVAVAVPGWWTHRARALVGRALDQRGLGATVLVDDTEAAVLGAVDAGTRLPSTVMVVDLGAQSCSAGVVQDCDLVPRAAGTPSQVHLEGGNELDALVLHHVLDSLAALGTSLEATDAEHVDAARAFLAECRRVREELSGSSVVTVAPALPGEARRLRIVREELEGLAAPWLEGVVRLVGACLEQHRGDVDAVLLVGGLARTPLVARAISAELDLDVVVDDDPRTTVARGAATLAVPVEVPQERRRSRLRRPERSERRRTRRALGAAARDDLVALPAAPTVPAPPAPALGALPPSTPRFEPPAPAAEPEPVADAAIDEEAAAPPVPADAAPVVDVVEERVHVEPEHDDVVDAVVVETPEVTAEVVETRAAAEVAPDPADVDPDVEDPDIEDALAEQAVVEAEVDREPSALDEPRPPAPAPAPQHHSAPAEPAPEQPTIADVAPAAEIPAAQEQPTPTPTEDVTPDAIPDVRAGDDVDAAVADAQPAGRPHALDVPAVEQTVPEIAVEEPPIGARVRRSAGLLDAALGASALDTGRFLVDGPARPSAAADLSEPEPTPIEESLAEEAPEAEHRDDEGPTPPPADEAPVDVPGTDLALVDLDEPAPAAEEEPEPTGLAARLRRRRHDRRVRRGKAAPVTEQATAASAVRALRATLDQGAVDPGDAGLVDDDAAAEVLDLTPVPWARAAELQERMRLAEAGLLDPDTLMDLSVLSGGRP